jgi:hypothetical protein
MFRIGPLLILVVDIFAVWDILKSDKEMEKKILWIVIVILAPLLGAIAWYLFSRRIIN